MRKFIRHLFSFNAVLSLTILLTSQGVFAEPTSEYALVTRDNVESVREVLPDPILSWVLEKGFSLHLKQDPSFPFLYPKAWTEESQKNAGHFSFDSQGHLMSEGGYVYTGGAPFGQAKDIDMQVEPKLKAQSLIWNFDTLLRSSGDFFYAARIVWFGSKTILRDAEASLLRAVEPGLGKSEDVGAPTYWRELLQFSAPSIIRDRSYLSLRTASFDQDRFLVYSPVMQSLREVFPVNREDAFLKGEISPDDFFMLSQNFDALEVRVKEETTLLVPFSNQKPEEVRGPLVIPPALTRDLGLGYSEPAGVREDLQADLCIMGPNRSKEGSRAMTLFNSESRSLPGSLPWIPSTVSFSPRKVWVLELRHKDWSYSSGRQELVIDKQTMLPAYKFIYSKEGALIRVMIAIWGLAETSGKNLTYPYLSLLIAAEPDASAATAFVTRDVYFGLERDRKKFQHIFTPLHLKKEIQHEALEPDKANKGK